MLETGFMSQVAGYKKIELGHIEILFLRLFSAGNKSAYDVFSSLKQLTLDKQKKKSMAYKNVHKRVKRLHILKLIEVEKKFKRNAIWYRLTSYGLFQRLLLSPNPYNYPPVLDLAHKKDDVILRTILYQFFELETVKAFMESTTYSLILADYLRETCEAILKKLEEWGSPSSESFLNSMKYDMDQLITNRAKNFIYQIVNFSKNDGYSKYDTHYSHFEGHEHLPKQLEDEMKKYAKARIHIRKGETTGTRNQFTEPEELNVIRKLFNDKKFISLLNTVKQDFDEGCEVFL